MRDVRGKAHLSEETYSHDSFDPEIVPITTRKGSRTYVMLHPYMLDPIMQLTVRLSPYPQPYGAIGRVKESDLGGTRQTQIGNVQA
jgi:hypothetical protein